jgi:hypothetical protein
VPEENSRSGLAECLEEYPNGMQETKSPITRNPQPCDATRIPQPTPRYVLASTYCCVSCVSSHSDRYTKFELQVQVPCPSPCNYLESAELQVPLITHYSDSRRRSVPERETCRRERSGPRSRTCRLNPLHTTTSAIIQPPATPESSAQSQVEYECLTTRLPDTCRQI